jgi:hypothetical protein
MIITDQKIYSGSFLHSRFAYKYFRDEINPIGNIVAFRAPMDVTTELIDLEDKLSNDYIWSDDAINFCAEIPNICPVGMVAFQRLFNTQIANILSQKYLKKPIEVDGDDLICHSEHSQGGVIQPKGKCSVSICYVNNNIGLLHTGINISAGKRAPVFAYSTNLTDQQVNDFMVDVCNLFYFLVKDLFIASSKILV